MPSAYKRQVISQPILGIVKNVPAESIDPRAFVTAHNVVFRDGQVQKVRGWDVPKQTVGGSVNFIKAVRFSSSSHVTMVGTNLNMYQYSAQGMTSLNAGNFIMPSIKRWDADYLYNQWYFTNQSDGLWSWNGSGLMINLGAQGGTSGLDAINRAQYIAQFQNHILLGNISTNDAEGRYTIAGSSLLDTSLTPPINFTQDVNSDAIVFEVPEDASSIQSMKRLLNQLVIYKENSIHLLNYVGTGLEYNKTQVVTNVGVLAPASVLDLGDRHVYVGTDNLYQFNGSSNQAFGDRVWQFLNDDANTSYGPAVIWAFLDQRYREVIFAYIDATGEDKFNKALIWNYQYDSFSTRDFPFSAVGYVAATGFDPPISDLMSIGGANNLPISAQTTPLGQSNTTQQKFALLAGDQLGNLYTLDDPGTSIYDAAGTPIIATLETGDMNFGTQEQLKICSGVDLYCPSVTGTPLQVWVSARKMLSDAIEWQGPYLLNNPDNRGVDFFATGVWFRFKFVKNDGSFKLDGWAPRVQVRGYF